MPDWAYGKFPKKNNKKQKSQNILPDKHRTNGVCLLVSYHTHIYAREIPSKKQDNNRSHTQKFVLTARHIIRWRHSTLDMPVARLCSSSLSYSFSLNCNKNNNLVHKNPAYGVSMNNVSRRPLFLVGAVFVSLLSCNQCQNGRILSRLR